MRGVKVDFDESEETDTSLPGTTLIGGSQMAGKSARRAGWQPHLGGALRVMSDRTRMADGAFARPIRTLTAILFTAMVATAAPAYAETCESLAHRIVASEGGVIVSLRQIGFIAIKHPLTYSFSVSCGKVPTVTIGSQASPASPEFFDLVGRVTALFTPVAAGAARAAAKRCINTALVSTNTAKVLQDGVEFSCFPISEEGDVPTVDIRRRNKPISLTSDADESLSISGVRWLEGIDGTMFMLSAAQPFSSTLSPTSLI